MAAAAAVASAENINMMLPFFDDQELGAVSIGGNSDATTYVVGCQADLPSDECGMPYPMVVIQGPKTMAYKWVMPDNAEDDEGDFS